MTVQGQDVLTEFTLEELAEKFRELGVPAYRARQVLGWLYGRGVTDFERMSDLPRSFRGRLAESFRPLGSSIERESASADGTRKFLVELWDSERIETVLIPSAPMTASGAEPEESRAGPRRSRWTLCVSTQVGCPVRCVFCASGLGGMKRNLTAGEIVEQFYQVFWKARSRRDSSRWAGRVDPPRRPIDSVVVMGMGEPLLNVAALKKAIEILGARWGFGLGMNRVTVSTVGLVDPLGELAKAAHPPNLAVSLHAPSDALRKELIPYRRAADVGSLLEAAMRYRRSTGKEVTFEYVLLDGINSSPACAKELARKLSGSGCKVNLIPYNPVAGLPYRAPASDAVQAFERLLRKAGIRVMVRQRRGEDIDAACGQLAMKVQGCK